MTLRTSYGGHDLVVAETETQSNVLTRRDFGGARGFVIQGPATLPETCTVQVSLDDGETFADLVVGGEVVTVGADQAVAVDTVMAFDALRLEADGAAAADRMFLTMFLRDH